ncbi:MAG: TolC family protein [Myxococcales bacterium]|nr:TolC family protein [Myxococcales bacterium]
MALSVGLLLCAGLPSIGRAQPPEAEIGGGRSEVAGGPPAAGAVAQEGVEASNSAPSPEQAAARLALDAPEAAPIEPDVEALRAQLAGLRTPGGLTAIEAARRAVARAPSLERAEASVRVARAAAARVRLRILPQAEISARYTRLSSVDNPDLVPGFSFPVILDQYALRISATYPVSDVFFRVLPAHDAAVGAVEAQRVRGEVDAAEIAARTREVYYEHVRALAALEVARSAVAQAEAHRGHVEALLEGGVISQVELLRVRASLASARVLEARARGAVNLSRRTLAVLIGEDEASVGVGEDLTSVPPPGRQDREALVAEALERRPEARALRQLIVVEGRRSRAAWGSQLPQFLVQANLDYANPNSRFIPQEERFGLTWDLSAVLRWSPNEMLDARAEMSESRARVAELEADLQALREGMDVEIVQALEEEASARAALTASLAAVVAAEESYRVRLAQLEAGVAVSSDLIDAEAELTRARIELVDSVVALRIARVRFDRALGVRGWEP